MVRANGQRDGVGKTRQLSGAFEHTGAILDLTRVSPYRPAAVAMPQSMRPDTRQHLTACTEPSQEMSSLLKQAEALAALGARLPRARSPAAVNPLRGSFASAPALAGDCRGRPCGKPLRASQKAGHRSTGTRGRLRETPGAAPLSRRTDPANSRAPGAQIQRRLRKGLQFRRRPHTTVAGRDSHPLRNGGLSRRTE